MSPNAVLTGEEAWAVHGFGKHRAPEADARLTASICRTGNGVRWAGSPKILARTANSCGQCSVAWHRRCIGSAEAAEVIVQPNQTDINTEAANPGISSVATWQLSGGMSRRASHLWFLTPEPTSSARRGLLRRFRRKADINHPTTAAKSVAIDPGCVKTTSQIEIVSGFSETIDATVH